MLRSKDTVYWLDLKKKTNLNAAYQKLTSELMTHTDWKWGDGKIYFMQMEMTRK